MKSYKEFLLESSPLDSARSYMQGHSGSFDSTIHGSVSSLRKQAAIGLSLHLANTHGEAYKKAVFAEYQKHMPELLAKHNVKDYDDLMHKSYKAVEDETVAQYRSLPIKIDYHEGDKNYRDSKHMVDDVVNNDHMFVFSGGDRHDFLHHIDPKSGRNSNELFRAVHDYYGHAINGNGFGAKGEEVAWELHKKMFSPLASLAMSAETRGQNSFVNYTKANSDNQKKMEMHRRLAKEALNANDFEAYNHHKNMVGKIGSEWNYAPQKSFLLPPQMLDVHYKGEMPESLQKLVGNHGIYDVDKDEHKLLQLAKQHNTSSYLTSNGGIYDREGAKEDFRRLLQLHGYSGMSKDIDWSKP